MGGASILVCFQRKKRFPHSRETQQKESVAPFVAKTWSPEPQAERRQRHLGMIQGFETSKPIIGDLCLLLNHTSWTEPHSAIDWELIHRNLKGMFSFKTSYFSLFHTFSFFLKISFHFFIILCWGYAVHVHLSVHTYVYVEDRAYGGFLFS